MVLSLGCHTEKGLFGILEVDRVPSWFPVDFALFTTDSVQYVAYYDTAHTMTIAVRDLESHQWDIQKLPSKVGWDSHNYLSVMVDSLGYIHLVGNMHSSRLVYFKSSEPHNIHSLEAIHQMVGTEEDVITYPNFIVDKHGKIIFHYRYGRSGDGYEVYNYLNVENQQWKRLLDVPLMDGEGKMNAYMTGPVRGPDDYYHMIWVWRDTWDCSTNHTLSYARSRNLIDWESIRGVKIELPITYDQEALYVDTTPPKGGLINIGIEIGFDSDNKPLIGYHKYGDEGNTQLFIARYEDNRWNRHEVTDWDYRWDFKGMGTIENELLIESPFVEEGTGVVFGYHHVKYGNGQIILDEYNLEPVSTRDFLKSYPGIIDSVRSDYPGMQVNKVLDHGTYKGEFQYLLRWESLPPNRDDVIEEDKPAPSMLEVIKFINREP